MKQLMAICLLFIATISFAQPKWQQHVVTKMDVKLDDKKHMLHGFEELTYTNNSPDTLRYIYMHLWPNAYKNDHTPFAKQQDRNRNSDFYYSKKEDRGYIDSLQFIVDGIRVDHYSSADAPDIARIDLLKPLLPGQKIKIGTPFRVKLPVVFSRNGHTGQAYYVSQFFPKPAVYDQKGWHPISYLDQGEFYSEFGSYDVNIILPSNYVLMATGNCMDETEKAWLDSLARKPLPSDTLYEHSTPPSSTEMKSIHYVEDNVHDFAWFADKRFVVRKDTVYSPGNNKLVTTWSAFLPSFQEQWKNSNKYLKDAIRYYGKWVGPYPYNTMKAVLGDMKAGGGMEYPTITLIDRVASAKLSTVIIHEAGHNWFYGMLGSNEREHAWMDEGINTFYEQKTTDAIDTTTKKKGRSSLDESLLYYQMAATGEDQPINLHSEKYYSSNYGLDVYYKTNLMLRWLEQYMGAAEFEASMKDYFETWHYHHPYPEDFRAIMEKHTSKQLGWFFDTILNTDKKIDFKILRAKIKDGKTQITVKNTSGVTSPLRLMVFNHDSATHTSWTAPFSHKAMITYEGTRWNTLCVDDVIPDAKSANDMYKRRALFRRFGLALKPLAGLNRSYKEKIFLTASLGNNKYDGIMAGLVLHNLTLPENRFAFIVVPMFSLRTETFVGAGSIGYTWYGNGLFKDVMLMADAKTFHMNDTKENLAAPIYARYIKIAPSLQFTFNEHDKLSPVIRLLSLKAYNISEDGFFFADSLAVPSIKQVQNTYAGFRYLHTNKRVYNPFSYSLEGHGNANFAKLNLNGNIIIDYNTRKKSLYVRGYIGKFFALVNNPASVSRYWLNASYGGQNDYLYDGTYRGRNSLTDVAGQQLSTMQEGGFKVPSYNGAYRSDNWMAAVNLKTDLPKIALPIRLFFDAGLRPNPNQGFTDVKNTELMYDGGIEIYFSKDIVSFYFPLIMSSGFRDNLSATFGNKNVFAHSISFTLHLQNINWLRTPSRVLKSM